jgi:hypothetical protein
MPFFDLCLLCANPLGGWFGPIVAMATVVILAVRRLALAFVVLVALFAHDHKRRKHALRILEHLTRSDRRR